MSKFEVIKKKYEAAQAIRERLSNDISELKNRQQALDDEAHKLAENGDTDGYMIKKAEADRAGAELYVKQMQLNKSSNPISEEEARAAWLEYVKKADKELKAAWNTYDLKRRSLASDLKHLIAMQEDRLSLRAQCADYVTRDRFAAVEMSKSFHCYLINANDLLNDRLYLKRLGELSLDDDIRVGRVSAGSL